MSINVEPVTGKSYQIPEDMIKVRVPINDTDSFIITTDDKVYMQTNYDVYSSRDITNMGILALDAMRTSNNTPNTPLGTPPIVSIEWPLRINKSRDVLFSHNETVALWYSSPNDGTVRLWRGEAWAIPDEYNDLFIMKFFGAVADNIWESNAINIIVNATDDTPKNLPPKCHDNSGCSDSMKEE